MTKAVGRPDEGLSLGECALRSLRRALWQQRHAPICAETAGVAALSSPLYLCSPGFRLYPGYRSKSEFPLQSFNEKLRAQRQKSSSGDDCPNRDMLLPPSVDYPD